MNTVNIDTNTQNNKAVLEQRSPTAPHWVGDGFHVHTLFDYQGDARALSPFLLMDYAPPTEFTPSARPRGVGEHPHRGFETVTIAYHGEISHQDSSGGGGTIEQGDIQWMTAGAGIMHEEFHSKSFSQTGGTMEMVQLWVNLPAKDKMHPPRYQHITADSTPIVSLDNEAGTVRIIAGEFKGEVGPANTFTPVNLWDVTLKEASQTTLSVAEGHTLALLVRRGQVRVNGSTEAQSPQLIRLGHEGSSVMLEAMRDSELLLLSGEPIDEPVVGQGPFVMNTRAEIFQAFTDFQSGQFGQLKR